uniref:MBL fold metallo-hydrolase n=1 Tax=Archaeoglobus fulgidus TaxID=2234 RepID=A0A7C3M8W1_ARCFL
MKEVLPNIYLIDTLKYVEEGVISSYVVADAVTAIIDPGTDKGADIILEEIDRNWNVGYICPTHIHIDHGGGAAKLAKALDAKIIVHPKGVRHVVNPERLWEASKAVLGDLAEIYGKPESVEENRVIAVDDGEEFELGEERLKVFHAPGHAPHMLVYYLTNSRVLFPADAVGMCFDDVVFPLTPPPFDADAALKTLEKLMSLKVDYVAFTHYGVVEGDWSVKRSYEKIKSWIEIAKEVAEAQGSVEEFVNRLKIHDEDVGRLFRILENKPIAQSFIYTSAAGMLDAVRGLQ